MKEKTETFNQGKRYFFYILMFAILGWFIFMQIFGADERSSDTSAASVIYSGTVTWQKPDGTTQEISVPGTYKVPVGDTMVLTIQLPDDLTDTCFAIRSSLQDVDFYVGDDLRTSYSTHKTRLVGKNSASRYVFCPVYASDAGKELRIELTTYTSNYTGVVNPVYCGNKADIWIYIFSRYGLETYIAFFILFAGIVTILFSFALGLVYHTRFDMEYLGWCMVMGAVWMLGESKLRQFLVPNASALGSLCFVMILLCPLPILFFADSLQKGLHHRFYVCLGSIAMINFAVCTILTAAGIADYIETMPVSHGILAITVATIFVHLFQYIRTEKNKADRLLLIGLLAAILCIAVETTSVYFVTLMSGLFVGAGMLILLFVNIVRAIKNVQDIELKRQQSEIRKNQEQNEKMSLQMIQTLSTTIEAKDAYTRGHSYRVAQYAALIAEELGWTPEEILNLKRATHLHDIGKIGIPDPFLNKPAQLTDDEYNLIKKHTVIGAEILKDITLIPHAAEIARSHHERYDGKGYPDGLAGTEIPIHARIVAVADCYDAMNSRRIYRNALPPEVVYEEFRKNRGTQFDPEITDIFLKLLKEKRLPQWDPSQEEPDTYNLPDTDPNSLSLQMDDLFQKFHTITTDDPELRFATLSAGLCLCSTDDSFEDCYSKADKALYYVKQNGKNQFFFYQQIDRSTLAASGSGKDLELVAESLQKSGIYVGALDLNYRDFARQYEYMSQLVTRSQCRCYLAMITLETLVDTVPDIDSIEQALEYMEQAIRQNIRRVDICTRYSSLQYLIILFEPDETHIPDIIERIFTQYYRQCDNHDFQPSYEYLEISPQEL